MYTLKITETPDGELYEAVHDVEVDWSDQTGFFNPTKVISAITLVGCGGIGSNVAYELITMGFRRFVLYDDDVVEPRNLASQKAYRHDDLYKPKVKALAIVLIEHGATEVLIRQRRFTADDIIDTPVVIGGVDSMASRQLIWDAVTNSPDVELYLDGRLNGEVAQVCAIEPNDADWYLDTWLFPDSEGMKGGDCTKRAIVYPATLMAGMMCRDLSRWFLGLPICQWTQIHAGTMEILKVSYIDEE